MSQLVSVPLAQGADTSAIVKKTNIAGAYWHRTKLGWVSKNGAKGVHFTAAEAAAQSGGPAPKRRRCLPTRPAGERGMAKRPGFHYVVPHHTKQVDSLCVANTTTTTTTTTTIYHRLLPVVPTTPTTTTATITTTTTT